MMSRPFLLALAIASAALSACAPARTLSPAPTPATAEPRPPAELLGEPAAATATPVEPVRRDLLGDASYDLPVEANSWVEAELDFLVGQRRDVIGSWLARGDPYESWVRSVLKSHGLPTDLYYLAMIESAFVPTVRSRAGAVGFWQFMPGTARDVGLRIDSLVDERMDPVRSTRAAARHLRGLHRELRDWPLAAAAYNAGSGRISRGLRASGTTDFWQLAQRGDLAAETRQYVPRLYAVTVIGKGRDRFGFPPARAAAPFAFDSIQVEYATPLEELARLGAASREDLARLNPHLVRGTTPGGGYWVWVPAGTGEALQRAWLASDFRRDQGYGSYQVRRGDSLGDLADLADLRATRIRELNPEVDWDRLPIGTRLRLPYKVAQRLSDRPVRTAAREERTAEKTDKPTKSESAREEKRAAPDEEKKTARPAVAAAGKTHSVATGESLWTIAQRHGVSVAALQQANGLADSTIRPGQTLQLPSEGGAAAPAESAAGREHVVRSGESLWSIAREHGSSVGAIQKANHLGEDEPIRPGQRLSIPAGR